jgi:hypothetical protein
VGNTVSTCNADGSAYLANPKDCGTDACYNGQCLPKVCTTGANNGYFCQSGDIYLCTNAGTLLQLSQDCGSSARCVAGAGISCVPYDCFPGTTACLKNQVGMCSDDGTSLSSVKDDCAGNSQVCTADNKCADTALDELGNGEDVASDAAENFIGDAVLVESSRQLTQIEADVVMPSDRTLRWVVLEQVGSSFNIVYDAKTSQAGTSGWVSSGPLSYLLKAGTTYLIGLIPSGGNVAVLDDLKPWSSTLSFGRIQGSLVGLYYYSYYVQTDRIYHLRITTGAP